MHITFGQTREPKASPIENRKRIGKKAVSQNQEKLIRALSELKTTAIARMPDKGRNFSHIRKEVRIETAHSKREKSEINRIRFTIAPSRNNDTPDNRMLKTDYFYGDDEFFTTAIYGASPKILKTLEDEDFVDKVIKEITKFNAKINS